MLIDWFTVTAQIVNFLVLVWLLRRFLYRPILDAIDAREQRVAAAMTEAEANKKEAQRERDVFHQRNEEFIRQRAALLREAIQEVKIERENLYTAARKEAEDFRTRQQEAMIDDCNTLKDEILRRTREEVFAIARKALADLAGVNLEQSMVDTFLGRCRSLDAEERSELQAVLQSPVGPVCIRSTFPLADSQRQAIEREVAENFNYAGQFCYECAPDLISGIAVSMDGHQVAWNITEYLLALEQGITDLLLGQPSADGREAAIPATGYGTVMTAPPSFRGAGRDG
ncbi:MAG: F0F1 ATP synthase subunit B [Desulfobulbaceae bacterium]|nr:MAG: F0F1 ATP synthase subunit B [Desulfobulbaceae bacterium]